MDKIELIKAEIERRITDNTFGAKMELIDLLAFIDNLPEDEPSENIGQLNSEEEEKMIGNIIMVLMSSPIEFEEEIRFLKSLRPSWKPSEELNKAAEEYAQDETMSGLAERAFKAGAEWQKEQMLNYVQGKYDAYQEEYDDYYAGLRVAYGDVLKKLKENEK